MGLGSPPHPVLTDKIPICLHAQHEGPPVRVYGVAGPVCAGLVQHQIPVALHACVEDTISRDQAVRRGQAAAGTQAVSARRGKQEGSRSPPATAAAGHAGSVICARRRRGGWQQPLDGVVACRRRQGAYSKVVLHTVHMSVEGASSSRNPASSCLQICVALHTQGGSLGHV